MPDILSLGEPLWEMSEIPSEPGKYLLGYGGDTANFCVAAARQGADVGYITRVGRDSFGDTLRAIWDAESIDVSNVVADEQAMTGGYFIHHSASGHSFQYARAGSAASKMSAASIDPALVRQAKFVHSSGITQAISHSACDAVSALFDIARAANVATVFDSNFRSRLWTIDEARHALASILPRTDYFFPSLEDAQALSGLADRHSIIQWAHQLGAQYVLLKLGAEGVLVSDGLLSLPQHVPAFKVDAIDATGAGDCFAGATVARLLVGDTLHAAARYGCAAAALTTTQYGAIAAIPTGQRVTTFLQSNV
ncbi:MAG: sugar kinase [Burkholderiales bacterium]|nr:MAG: sugar kinase [Betaproteobacteria bacterium]TAG28993.1 MAG: sugar kinase [Burkholderiales bacterium]